MTSSISSVNNTDNSTANSNSWRVVDIIVGAVLGVAFGVIFWIWTYTGGTAYGVFNSMTPGLGGLVTGVWVMAGVVGGLVIRKPGAALFVELLAAFVSMILGNKWGIETIYSGIAQGLGAELVFLAFRYRKFNVWVAMLAGVGAQVLEYILELFTSGNLAKSLTFNVIYLASLSISGVILAGLLGWILVRGLAATGALDRFAAGREVRKLV